MRKKILALTLVVLMMLPFTGVAALAYDAECTDYPVECEEPKCPPGKEPKR